MAPKKSPGQKKRVKIYKGDAAFTGEAELSRAKSAESDPKKPAQGEPELDAIAILRRRGTEDPGYSFVSMDRDDLGDMVKIHEPRQEDVSGERGTEDPGYSVADPDAKSGEDGCECEPGANDSAEKN